MAIKFTQLPSISVVSGTEILACTDMTATPTSKQVNVDQISTYILSGNSATATKLETPRFINGVSFDGAEDINITVNANALVGNTLNSNILNSSLTSVGTLTNLTVTNPIEGSITGNAATVTTNANLTGIISSVGNATSISSQSGLGSTLVTAQSPIFTTSIDGTTTFNAFPSCLTLTIGNTGTLASITNISTGPVAALTTKTVNIGTGGGAFSTTNVTIGSANGGTVTLACQAVYRLFATSAPALTIASANTIAPANPISFVSGTQQIQNITPPPLIALTGGQITLIPTGTWTTSGTGNIAIGSNAVVNRALILTYDSVTQKWYPSY